jgi:4-amino-4-deoxy-L-arabinose transferase-like glycosyltransferase
VGVAPPILAENFVFVSLLALGCYQLGRRAFNPAVGLLSVIFALGSPLIISQFHVFMIDAPETAMVAVCLWAIVATEGFSRIGVSALAGIAVGLGMLTKEPLAIFVVGPLAVTAIRGGRRAWRGLAVFTIIALALALPWYIHEHSAINGIGTEAIQGSVSPRGIAPPRWSLENFEWYFWNLINHELLLPLFLFAAVGWTWMVIGLIRRRSVSRLAPELTIGAFVAWFGLTVTFVHDYRYSMPLLAYLAVLGSFWVTRLPRPGRIAAVAAFLLAVTVNTLGASFGAGVTLTTSLPGASATALESPGQITFSSKEGFLVAGPKREGDLLSVMRALKRRGVEHILWEQGADQNRSDFSNLGIEALALIAGLDTRTEPPSSSAPPGAWSRFAFFAYGPIADSEAQPCLVLDGSFGVWVQIGNPNAQGTRDYCPSHHPQVYGPSQDSDESQPRTG